MNNTKYFLLAIALVFINLNTLAQWSQIGLDIDGDAAGDQSGTSVSMSADGLIMAVGARYNDGNASNSGHVKVYTLISGTWVQMGGDIDGDATNDRFGEAVSISANGFTVAIGAGGNDGNAFDAGHVRVYKLISGAWTQRGGDIEGEAAEDLSGGSISLSADGLTVAIGAIANDGNGSNAGHVRVYKLITGAWTQQGGDIDGEAADDLSGSSVSLSANGLTLAIGASSNDGNGSWSGHVRVHKLITGVWIQQGGDIDGEAVLDHSGRSVSLSTDGLTVAIGAPENDGNGQSSGHVRIYKFITGNWSQQGGDIDGEAVSDMSGSSVTISGDGLTVAIGSSRNNLFRGHMRIYKMITGVWIQQGGDIDGESTDDSFGVSVSMSTDGLTVAIGANGNDGNGSNAGHVRVYSNCTATSGTDIVTSCDSYLWIDNNTYTASNSSATYSLTNSNNSCDSVVTLDLTINYSTIGTDIATACDSYLWIDNNTYLANNSTATYILTNTEGCDSVVTLNLTINTVDVTTTLILDSITSNATSATYRWLDCNNNTVISGETDALFIASANGSYAVEVTQNGCVDTSTCVNVTGVGVGENSFGSSFKVYPNPTSGNLSIALGEVYNTISLKLLNIRGQLIDEQLYQSTNQINYNIKAKDGIYFIELISKYNEKKTIKVIKN